MAWTPEIAVDRELARRLIGSQFPELELRSLELIGEGWDNTVWLVDGEWAFRFPRRAVAVPLVERELAVLPRIAPLVSAPVPVPQFRGEPTAAFPWPYLGARFIVGDELGRVPADESAFARDLGAFLAGLHAARIDAELTVDPNRRMDMARRVEMAQDPLAALRAAGLWEPPALVGAIFEEAVALTPPEHLVTAHGDLHFRHVLVNEHGRLAGVIDWGDVCVAAPGIDLLLYWSAFGAAGRDTFSNAYGPIATDDLARARVLAIGINAILAEYGHREGRTSVRDEALASLARTMVD
jgi:aminoglycoside phosphotransferase (APT) family kinase protein